MCCSRVLIPQIGSKWQKFVGLGAALLSNQRCSLDFFSFCFQNLDFRKQTLSSSLVHTRLCSVKMA